MLHALRRLIDAGYRHHYTIVGDGDEHQRLLRLTREIEFDRFCAFCRGISTIRYGVIFALVTYLYCRAGLKDLESSTSKRCGVKPVIGCTTAGGPQDLAQLGDCIELVAPQAQNRLWRLLQRLLDDLSSGTSWRYRLSGGDRALRRDAMREETFAVYGRVLPRSCPKTEFLAELGFSGKAHE